MKLNENNSNFAVKASNFHGGNIISFHNSLKEALKTERKNRVPNCKCGCAYIIPLNEQAKKALLKNEYYVCADDVPAWNG